MGRGKKRTKMGKGKKRWRRTNKKEEKLGEGEEEMAEELEARKEEDNKDDGEVPETKEVEKNNN